ncbi:MAG: TonB-dependent receptor, partial [Marinilabiliales bacterium]
VTTKQGTKGAFSITYDGYTGMQQVRKKIDMLSAQELAILANEAADNANVDRKLIYASPTNLGEGTDWQDEIFRVAPIQNHQLSFSGGTERTTYSISLNYFNQEGIILSSDFQKGNLRINLANNVKENIKIGTSVNMNRSVLNGVVTDSESAIPSSVTSWALEFNPGLAVYDENGDYTYENNTSKPSVGNPVADALETEQINISNRFIGNLYLEWDLADYLKFRSSVGGDAYFNNDKSFVPNYLKRAEASNGQAALGSTNGYTWLVENTLNLNKKINNHSVNALIGHSLQEFDSEYQFLASSDFDDNRLGYNAIQMGSQKTLMLSGSSGWQMQSVISRINYNFKEKYLLTVTGRLDGSSKFGSGNKYGFFPSFSAAWRVTQEGFWNDNSKISNLKLRAGYGQVGNEGIPPYSSLGLLEITEAYFGETEIAVGAGPSTFENSDLKWETTEQVNVGFDIGFYANRISVTSDFYLKETSDLLLNMTVPYISGYKYAYTNVGNMKNYGFEITANTVNFVGDFSWNTIFNFAVNKNEITKLTGEDDLVGQSILGINGWTRITEGEPIGTFYGFKTDGIIQLDEDPSTIPYFVDYTPSYGDRKYVDVNDDGVINESDKVVLGNASPDFTYGLTNTFRYKSLSLNIYIQGVYGNEIVNFNRFALESFDGNRNNSTAALERWTASNPTNEYPRANAAPRANTLSDVQVEDGSYLRIKDVTLSYAIPHKFIDRIKVSSLHIFVSAKNLYTLTSYSGFDPEVSRFANDNLSMGADYGSYPSTKLYTIGISLKL